MFALAPIALAVATTLFSSGTQLTETFPGATERDAAVAFVGQQPVIVWRDTVLRSAAWSGAPISPANASVLRQTPTSQTAIAANEEQAYAVWIADGVVEGIRIGADGKAIGHPIPLSSAVARRVAVAASRDAFLVVWAEQSNSIYSRLIGRNGQPFGEPVLVSGGIPPTVDTIAAASDGDGFLVTWDGVQSPFGGILAALVSSAGAPLAFTPLYVSTTGVSPAVAWNGSDFLIVWDSEEPGIRGRHVSQAGELARTDVKITALADHASRLAWDGSGYVLGTIREASFHQYGVLFLTATRVAANDAAAEPLTEGGFGAGLGVLALAARGGRALLVYQSSGFAYVSEAALGAPQRLPRRRL